MSQGAPTAPLPFLQREQEQLSVQGCAVKAERDHFSPSAQWLQLWALCRVGPAQRGLGDVRL